MIMALLPVKRSQRETNDLARLHKDMDDLFHGFFDGDNPSGAEMSFLRTKP